MANNVLILYESSEFMVDSLMTNLKKVGMESKAMGPTSANTYDEIRKADVILLYIGDFITIEFFLIFSIQWCVNF